MEKYVGYKQADYSTAYAKFYDETFASITLPVLKGLNDSPFAAGKIPPLSKATILKEKGYQDIENGYTLEADGSAQVAVLTPMPNVAPYMWDWWFGWHGSRANRYKLWHPKAHINAQWKDGNQSLDTYIERTSLIEEYIGKKLEKAAIQFFSPTELGFLEGDIADKSKVVYICARLGYARFPLDFGYLVHQIRQTETGSEMRSRFWLGGEHIQLRMKGALPNFLSKIIRKLRRIPRQQAIDLMTHCTEEMNHLAAFLPKIYAELHQK
jgi:DAPG hydrolase PhiG domain